MFLITTLITAIFIPEKEDLVNLLIRYVGSTGSYNDVRQPSSAASAGFPNQANFSESDQSGTSSNQPQGRRSSVPNLPSPTDAPPPRAAPSNSSQNTPHHDTRRSANSSNVPSPTSPTPSASPVVSSPVLGAGTQRHEAEMDFEELLDWEMVGETTESGPEPVVSEIDDEVHQQTAPPIVQNDVNIDEVIDEHLRAPVEPPVELSELNLAAEESPAQVGSQRSLLFSSHVSRLTYGPCQGRQQTAPH